MIGHKYGTLTILEEAPKQNGLKMWRCQCICGNIKDFPTGNLRRKDYRPTCGKCVEFLPQDLSGYKFSELPVMSTAKDYTDKTIGDLKVLNVKRLHKGKTKQIIWNCECLLCGVIFERTSSSLNQSERDSINSNCGCTHYKERSKESLKKELFRRYKKGNEYRKRKQGRVISEFELTYSEFSEIINKPCNYCGVTHSEYLFRGHILECNGVDRVDSEKGYFKGNIVPCCKICNKAKNDLSLEEWNNWLDRIISFRR